MAKNTTLTFTMSSIDQSPVELINDASAPTWDDLVSGRQRPEERAHDNQEAEAQEPQPDT